MSIAGAVAELNKEIERITKIRDSLLQGAPSGVVAVPDTARTSAAVTKTAAVKKSGGPKKRTLSPEARKRISDANKARWAAAKKSKTTK